MGSTSEVSFGQRYTLARGLVEYLKTLPAYTPNNAEIEPPALTTFLDSVEAANSDAASKLSVLQTARAERVDMFRGVNGMLTKSGQLRDYIASVHPDHKKAQDYIKVQKLARSMRGRGSSKKSAEGEEGTKRKTSRSEQSYGAILSFGKDILEVIKTIPAYNPSNAELSVAGFTSFIQQLDAKNSEVAEKNELYDNSAEARRELYAELKMRVSKVKLALAAQFGRTSNEFKDAVKY
jgi:hypothetical protein